MHYEREGIVPAKKVGQMSADDVNYAIHTLDAARHRQAPAAESARRAPLHAEDGPQRVANIKPTRTCRS